MPKLYLGVTPTILDYDTYLISTTPTNTLEYQTLSFNLNAWIQQYLKYYVSRKIIISRLQWDFEFKNVLRNFNYNCS